MINLFINYYNVLNEERQKELDFCIRKNISNPLINKVYIFLDKKVDFYTTLPNKVHLINLDRPTYASIIKYINSKDEFKDSYNVISNTDIYFDHTISLLKKINMENTCVDLNRWDVQNDGSSIFLETKGSQDVWIFKGKIKEELKNKSNFYLGRRCCDNVFLNNLMESGYRTVCPSYDIRAHHLHNVDFRTWEWGVDEIPGKHMYIDICTIEDLEEGKPTLDYYDTSTTDNQGSINLFINYYISKNLERQKEIDECFKKNCQNQNIHKIYTFASNNTIPKIQSKKIILVKHDTQPNYSDFISYINTHTKLFNSYNIIANSDIYFDDSILLLNKINMNNTCVALTRWNVKANGELKFYNTRTSQDVWIFKGKVHNDLEETTKFKMGQMCCDNVFANSLYESGYRTINPCYDIKAFHLHNVEYRNWNKDNKNPGKHMYLYNNKLDDVIDKKSSYDIDKPFKTYLFAQYYNDPNPSRQKELLFCLEQNVNNSLIDVVFIFSEVPNLPSTLYNGDVHVIQVSKRQTYKDIISFINSEKSFENSYNIIANTDIFFDDSLKLINKVDFNRKTCVALTRHESNHTKKIIRFRESKYIGCSQDCWIFKGNVDIDNLDLVDFNFGVPGCDNRLAYELDRNGYKVLNPCKDIIIYHYHQNRLSRSKERIAGPYKNLELVRIGEL